MGALAESLVLYLGLCVVGTTAGLTILALARPDLRPGAALLLAPATCLALWAVVLGGGVAAGVHVRSLVGPLWVTSVALSAGGVWTLRRRWNTLIREDKADVAVLGLALGLPVATLWPYFWHHVADYPGSVAPDGWSYVAYAQYLWDHGRYEDGGLAPLYQYASHLSATRHVSAGLLGFLARWANVFVPRLPEGETQAGVGLLLAWGLYAFGTACGAAASTLGVRPAWVPGYLVLTVVSGWIGNIVYLNNFDNGTVLAFFPALAVSILTLPPGEWRPAVHMGLLGSGLLYTYPEMVPMVGASLGLFVVQRLVTDGVPLRRWILTVGLTLIVALGLTAPYLEPLVAFVSLQSYNAFAVRVGGTVFDGLLTMAHYPSAFWALGGEHQVVSHVVARNVLGGLLTLLAVGGLWAAYRQRQYGVLFTTALVLAGFGVLVLRHAYGYGAFKVLLMGWWVTALLPILGLAHLVRGGPERRASAIAAGVAVAAAAFMPLHEGSSRTREFGRQLQDSMEPARRITEISTLVGNRGVLLAVDGAWANQWAVHYLRNVRVRMGGLRSYMAQPWVVPSMDRAKHVPIDDLAYVLTDDRMDGGLGGRAGTVPLWSLGRYRLWLLPRPWAVIVNIGSPPGFISRGGAATLPLGHETPEMEILTSRPGTLNIAGTLVAETAASHGPFRMRIVTDGGYEATVPMDAGSGVIAVPVGAGRTLVSLRLLTASRPDGPGDAVLEWQDLRVSLGPGR